MCDCLFCRSRQMHAYSAAQARRCCTTACLPAGNGSEAHTYHVGLAVLGHVVTHAAQAHQAVQRALRIIEGIDEGAAGCQHCNSPQSEEAGMRWPGNQGLRLWLRRKQSSPACTAGSPFQPACQPCKDNSHSALSSPP